MRMIRTIPQRRVGLACDWLFELSAGSWFFYSPNMLRFVKSFTYIILPDERNNPGRHIGQHWCPPLKVGKLRAREGKTFGD